MSKPFRPMLAEDYIEEKLRMGGWASPKYDGIRSTVLQGVPTSRSGKPIPNPMVKELFGRYEHADGELIYGNPTDPDVYSKSYSAFMTSNTKKLDQIDPALFSFYTFDHIEYQQQGYLHRYQRLIADYATVGGGVAIIAQEPVDSLVTLDALEEGWLDDGFEGMMYRDATAPYKQGRATVEQGWLLKIKRFEDCEAVIIGFEEMTKNTNQAYTNEVGYTKRSTKAEGLIGKDTLGKLLVRGINGRWKDVEWRIGVFKGMNAKLRKYIWENQAEYANQMITCNYFPKGCKDRPRHPKWVWKGLRSPLDMG